MKIKYPDPAALHVPTKWYWHYRKLRSLRDSLIANREEQAAEFSEPLEVHSMDDADSATDEFDHNLALAILSHEEDDLYELDEAIRRIFDGTYGVCEVTGEAIPESRLRVVPWTRYTKEALESIERQQPDHRLHLETLASIQGPAPGGLPQAPEPEDLISIETARREREQKIRDFAGEAGLTISPEPTYES